MFDLIETEAVTGVRLFSPMLSISNAIFGGGLRPVSAIINYSLQPGEYPEVEEMPEFCRSLATNLDCDPQTTVVMLTTVPQRYRGRSDDGSCLITAGLGNAVPLLPELEWDEREGAYAYNPGTINTLIVSREALSSSALVEAYGTAKLGLSEAVRNWSDSYHPERELIGTPTDGLTIVCPDVDPKLRFAGLGSRTGSELIRRIREAFNEALSHRYPEFNSLEAKSG
ncbi:MAG: adenosylcobinamide amidohydrolase [Candidatus Paceibacterota bacterium]